MGRPASDFVEHLVVGIADGLGSQHAETDGAHVGLMGELVGHHLQYDLAADTLGRRDGVLHVVDPFLLRDGNGVLGEQALALRLHQDVFALW
ncbi:hypothetical protein D9M70_477990 [compost metagenome]